MTNYTRREIDTLNSVMDEILTDIEALEDAMNHGFKWTAKDYVDARRRMADLEGEFRYALNARDGLLMAARAA